MYQNVLHSSYYIFTTVVFDLLHFTTGCSKRYYKGVTTRNTVHETKICDRKIVNSPRPINETKSMLVLVFLGK